MIIGYDAKRAFLNFTGLGGYSRNLLGALSRIYPENTYVLYTPRVSADPRTEYLRCQKQIRIKTPQGLAALLPRSYWRTFHLASLLEKDQIDLFHGLSHELPCGINKSKVKAIVTIHDLIFMRYPNNYNALDRKIYRAKIKYSCKVADQVVAVSQQTKSDLEEFLGIDGNKVEVVYQTCDPIFYQPVSEEKKREVKAKYNLPTQFILNVGTIETRKNLLTLVKALNELKKSLDLFLVVIGRGKRYKQKVEKYIMAKKLNERVVFLSDVVFADFPAIYQLAQAFVYPSHFEGFGIPIIEALFSKTPVITSTGSCFSEAGGRSSLYVTSTDYRHLADAIARVLTDSTLRVKMITDGYSYVQQYRDDRTAEKMNTLYQNVVGT